MNKTVDSVPAPADKKIILLVTTLGSFLTPFMSSAVNIALPTIGLEFKVDAVLLNWIATSYILASAVFLVPFGKIADIYGRKKIYFTGVTLFTLSSVFSGLSTSVPILILFRIWQGVGSGMIFANSVAILTSAFPAGERGKAIGVVAASAYMGLSVGPFLGGLLIQLFGWRSIFFINIPFGLLPFILILWKMKGEWMEAKGDGFDLIGSIIYGISLSLIIYGFSNLPALPGIPLIICGLIILYIFIIWEKKVRYPILYIDLFRVNRVFALSSLAALISYSATFAVGFLLSFYLQYIKDLSPQVAGVFLVAQPLVQVVFSPLAGKLSDRVHPRAVAAAGMTVTAVGLSLFIFLTPETPLWFVVACLILLGIGFSLFASPNMNAIMGSVEKKYYGVASGILGTMRLVGQMLSMGLAMMAFSIHIGDVRITPEYFPALLKSIKSTFYIMTILCIGGIFASLCKVKDSCRG